jgi:hypothetical protein
MTKPRRNPHPTRAQVRQLLTHAPRIIALEQPVTNAGSDAMPAYADWWRSFIEVAIQDHFIDWDYEPERAWALLNDRERLARTSFEEWSSAFTLFVRAERFCDGYWGGAPETGEAAALMLRLEQLERNWDGAV